MIKLFSKGASFLLQVIFIVAGVLIFAWFDPFDFLSPTKTTLKNTPIQVESIREIGKLISAEYYGEVISSLDEVVEKELSTVTINFKDTIDYIHDHFEDAIQELQKVEKFEKKQKPYQYFEANFGHLIKTELFELYIKYVYDELSIVNSFTFKDFDETLTTNQKEKLFRKLYQNNNWKTKFNSLDIKKLTDIFNKDETKKSYKEYKKSKLVLIGRGWIKAGFNFEKFSERNFKYSSTNNKIYFIGLQPEILSKTINPWFIPEEGVEGFEFVIAEKGGLHNPEYVNKVKQRCLDKLEAQAMSKQILKKAKTNAERNLKSFFELILDKELKAVVFHTNYLTYTLDEITNDTIVNNDIVAIDSALLYYHKNYMTKLDIDSTLYQFIDTLKAKKIRIFDYMYPIDSRTSLFYEIIEDFKIDSFDYKKIANINQATMLDTLWNIEGLLNHSIDSIETVIAKDVIQFYKNLHRFIKYSDTKNSFNDPVLQKLRNTKEENMYFKLEEFFLQANK